MDVKVQVLGGFTVHVDGRTVERADWRRTAAERLVELLAVRPGHAVARELAVELMWPGAAPELGRTSLRKALYFARRLLPQGTIQADAGAIRLVGCHVDLDTLLEAHEALARGEGGGPARSSHMARAEALGVVLDLGRLPLLPDDLYEDWLTPLREHLRNRWQLVTIEAARVAAHDGRTGDALGILDAILGDDPTDEAAHRLAMECYVAEGRLHAARRQLEWCRRALADGLDAEPTPETVAVVQRAGRTPRRGDAHVAGAPLVGRSREQHMLGQALDQVGRGRAACVILRGPAGIGKTRLLETLLDDARAFGWRELAWQATSTGGQIPFAPFTFRLADLLPPDVQSWPEPERSALAALVPSTGIRPEITFADRSAIVFALFGVLRRLVNAGPLVLAIDDVGLVDASSVAVLEAVTAVLADAPILVALATRDDEVLPDRVRQLVDHLIRAGALDIRIGPMSEGDIEPLVLGHFGGASVAGDLVRTLATDSAGNPLFCLELVRSGLVNGRIAAVADQWAGLDAKRLVDPPESVRELVRIRTAALPGVTRELLEIAAMLGSEFAFDTLCTVLGREAPDVIRSLDDAIAGGLLAERGGGYGFAHPLYRAAMEASTGTAGSAIVDWRIARALAATSVSDDVISAAVHPDPTPVAQHALRAAELGIVDARPLAVEFGFEAAARALGLFERDAAMGLLAASIRAWERLPAAQRRLYDAARAMASLAEQHMSAGDETEARAAFRRAIHAARTPSELAVAYERFSWLPYRHGDFEGALSLGYEALAQLPADAVRARVIVESQVGWTLGRLHRLDAAIDVLQHSAALVSDADDCPERSSVLDRLGMMLQLAGRHDEAMLALGQALASALACHDARSELCRIHLAAALTRNGRPAEGRPHAYRALELAHLMGDWYLESVAAWGAAEVEDALGDPLRARALRERELGLLARIGGNAHNEAFSHAHLAHLARRLGDPTTADREAALACSLAARDREPGYLARIEGALAADDWAEVASG